MNDRTWKEEENELVKRRREELDNIKSQGVNPFPHNFEVTDYSESLINSFRDDAANKDVSVAGRIMSIRSMGKSTFLHIQDAEGRIQIYLRKDAFGESYNILKLLDIGDIIGVSGEMFRTKMGEVSVKAGSFRLLAKSLRPLPVVKERVGDDGNIVRYDPFSDKELRYRQRYVDLIVNPTVREVFEKRSRLIKFIRSYLDGKEFIEVETPVLQPVYGGAAARPFITHHNTLDMKLYLRIADELYLKRLLVGGFDKVYEIGKDFRNEGMDRNHNPEFTMLELYIAYKDYNWMMDFVEQFISSCVYKVHGNYEITAGGKTINFKPPWKRITLKDSILKYSGEDIGYFEEDHIRKIASKIGLQPGPETGVGKIIDAIFSKKVEPNLIQPTIVMDYPVVGSPLAKKHRKNDNLVERFEVIINGFELCNAFSELNDPVDQRARFMEQARLKAAGDEEAHEVDEDYLRALEYGMPPAAGLGVGIDRFVMLLTNQESIRDVILFPHMRPEDQ